MDERPLLTRVVNVHHRVPYDVYVGRSQGLRPGPFGSPIKLGRECQICWGRHDDRGSTLSCYQAWLRGRMESDPNFKAAVAALRGKVLGCFCKPQPCHGDVLAYYADRLDDGPSLPPPGDF